MGQTKRQTLTDVGGRLEADPDRLSQRVARDQSKCEIVARYRSAARPIIEELASIGFVVDSEWDFVTTPERYDAALSVLMNHFHRDYPGFVREGLARSFGRPWARNMAWDQILAAYLSEPNKARIAPPGDSWAPSGLKEGMAVALSEMAHRGDVDVLIRLISDPANGPSRIFFVKNLSRSKTPEAFDTLMRLSTDPDLSREIAFRMKSKLKRWIRISQQQSRAAVGTEAAGLLQE
jgi:hypothetical protein